MLSIRNIEVWSRSAPPRRCDLHVTSDGRLSEIRHSSGAPDLEGDHGAQAQTPAGQKGGEILDGSSLVLIPAGVDPQVHLRVPGQPEKETARSGLESAFYGGVAALLTMPNTKPVIDHADIVAQTRELLEPEETRSRVKALISAAISLGQRGKDPAPFAELAKAGVRAFTDDGVGVVSDDLMRAAFRASADLDLPILQHAEWPDHRGFLAAGPMQKQLGIPPYPAEAEFDMVRRDLDLLQDFPGARYHVLHASSAKTVDLVTEAKERGLRASCEVSPHHLYFTSVDIHADNSSFKMNPPLRGQDDRAALRQALADGRIDFVATDHAPHESAAKGKNFKTAAYGTVGLETSLPTLLDLVSKGELTPQRLVDVFAYQPARFLGLDPSFGDFVVGETFRGVIVDPKKDWRVDPNEFHSQSKNSCFTGVTLTGKIARSVIGRPP